MKSDKKKYIYQGVIHPKETYKYKIKNFHLGLNTLISNQAIKETAVKFKITPKSLEYLIAVDAICQIGDGYYSMNQIKIISKVLNLVTITTIYKMNGYLYNEGVIAFYRKVGYEKLFFVTVYGENILIAFKTKAGFIFNKTSEELNVYGKRKKEITVHKHSEIKKEIRKANEELRQFKNQ